MSQLKLRRELDEYMAKRVKKTRTNEKESIFARREYGERHITLTEQDIQALNSSGRSSVVIVDSEEQTFFTNLHDRVMDFFRKKKQPDD